MQLLPYRAVLNFNCITVPNKELATVIIPSFQHDASICSPVAVRELLHAPGLLVLVLNETHSLNANGVSPYPCHQAVPTF